MQERKNIRQLLLFVVLSGLAIVIFFLQRDERGFDVDAGMFRIGNIEKTDKIELERNGKVIKLQLTGNHWTVDDRYEADRQRVTILLATLEKAVPRRPVAAAQLDSIRQLLQLKGVKVSVYEANAVKRQFVVYGDPQKQETYYAENTEATPYIMTIPGYRVFIWQIYELTENQWRDKRIFGFRWENFHSLTVSYGKDPASGFEIERNDKRVFSVKGIPMADTSRVYSYLDDVSLLVCDEFVATGSNKRYDSLAKTPPMLSLEIRDIANRTYQLRLFPPRKDEPMILGVTGTDDLVLFDRRRVPAILKNKPYFAVHATPADEPGN